MNQPLTQTEPASSRCASRSAREMSRRVDAGDEAVAEAVGERAAPSSSLSKRVGVSDRAEDFLAHDPRPGSTSAKMRRLDEIAAVEILRPPAAEPRAARRPASPRSTWPITLRVLLGRDERPDVGVVAPGADRDPRRRASTSRSRSSSAIDASTQKPRAGRADLAGIAECAVGDVLDERDRDRRPRRRSSGSCRRAPARPASARTTPRP